MIPTSKTDLIAYISSRWFVYCMMACVALAGVLYIWQVNVSTVQSYAVREIEHEIAELQYENERLQQKVSSLQSIDSVMTRMQMLGLVKIENVRYLHVDDAMAVNR